MSPYLHVGAVHPRQLLARPRRVLADTTLFFGASMIVERTTFCSIGSAAREVALREAADLQAAIDKEGGQFKLAAGDWRYYTEKVRKARYDLDEQALRPYFKLDNIVQGAFDVANRLYGITFTPRPDLPVYHAEVKAYEVKDRDGSHLAVFYTDFHPRACNRREVTKSSTRCTACPPIDSSALRRNVQFAPMASGEP